MSDQGKKRARDTDDGDAPYNAPVVGQPTFWGRVAQDISITARELPHVTEYQTYECDSLPEGGVQQPAPAQETGAHSGGQ